MKCIIFLLLALSFFKVNGQNYKYYFIELSPVSKMEVQIAPELDAEYPDIENLIVTKRDTLKNGNIRVIGKKYKSYSHAFNTLAASGLEFVQLITLNRIGGANAVLAGTDPIGYMLWRKRL